MRLTNDCEENLNDLIATYGHEKLLKIIKKDRDWRKKWAKSRIDKIISVGDIVKIMKRKCGHRFELGEIVEVTEVCTENKLHYEVANIKGIKYFVSTDEVVLIKNK
jgi:hypothetical protein